MPCYEQPLLARESMATSDNIQERAVPLENHTSQEHIPISAKEQFRVWGEDMRRCRVETEADQKKVRRKFNPLSKLRKP